MAFQDQNLSASDVRYYWIDIVSKSFQWTELGKMRMKIILFLIQIQDHRAFIKLFCYIYYIYIYVCVYMYL